MTENELQKITIMSTGKLYFDEYRVIIFRSANHLKDPVNFGCDKSLRTRRYNKLDRALCHFTAKKFVTYFGGSGHVSE